MDAYVGQEEVLVSGPEKPHQTLHSTLDLTAQKETNTPRHQAKTADGCLPPPQERASSHNHPPLPPSADNLVQAHLSPAPTLTELVLPYLLPWHSTYLINAHLQAENEPAFCCQQSQASIPPYLGSLYPPLI